MHTGPFEIPNRTDVQLKAAVGKTRPLVRQGDRLLAMKIPHLRDVSFIWDPKTTEAPVGLREVARVQTLHTYGYYGMFKPSIAEVLCQMPADLDADFFEVVGPDTAADLNAEKDALNAGFHVATTIFYKAGK